MNSKPTKLDGTASTCKVVMVGESGVGKSSIINRFVKNTFSSDQLPTPGASFASKVMTFHEYDKVVKFDVEFIFKIVRRSGTLQAKKNTALSLKFTTKTVTLLY